MEDSVEPVDGRAARSLHQPLGFDVFAVRILYLVGFGIACLTPVQGDFWWLLRAGQDIWQTGHIPLTDHYSYTASGRFWPNHEWLWEVIAYALHRAGGMPLVIGVNAAAATGMLMVLRRLSNARGYIVPIIFALCIAPMTTVWTTRPQLTSMLLFAVAMLLLSRERYLLLPPLFLLWANLHAQVVMGGVLMGATSLAGLGAYLRTRTPESRRRALRITATTIGCALATLCTPLGTGLWRYVLTANGRPQQHRIAEWTSAFHLNSVTCAFWTLLAVSVIGVLCRRHQFQTWQTIVPLLAICAMAPLSMLAVRNIAFFVLAVIPALMTALEFTLPSGIGLVAHATRKLSAVGVVIAAGTAGVWAEAPPQLGWHPLPTALIGAVEACPGHLYNTYNEGAYLVWWTPSVKVFVDNRQDPYPAWVLAASAASGLPDLAPVFATNQIRCALLPTDFTSTGQLLAQGWSLAFQDRTYTLLVNTELDSTGSTVS